MSLLRRGDLSPIDLMLKDVADMSDYETFSLVILLIGLVISAITLGITIGKRDKNNRPAEVPPNSQTKNQQGGHFHEAQR